MRLIFLITILILIGGNLGQAQTLIQKLALYTQANLPVSHNDNVIPLVGASFGTTLRLTDSKSIMSTFALDIGLLRARVQRTPINDLQSLIDYDLRIYTIGSDLMVSFFLDEPGQFSLGVGAGVEYAFSQHSKGILQTTIFDVKGEEIRSYRDHSAWGDPENQLRGVLTLYLKHHFKLGVTKMTLGPFFDYGSVLFGEYENEVSSSKFGIHIGVDL